MPLSRHGLVILTYPQCHLSSVFSFLLKYWARERLEDQNINDKCQNWERWCGKRKCHTTTIASRINLSLQHLSLPLSVVSKRGRSFTSPLDITKDINLSPVTPIICIQLPVEVLGKRNIGPSTYLSPFHYVLSSQNSNKSK